MCKNFNKEGYSCAEVGQILGCCQQTVYHMIDRKQIEALIKEPTNPGGRRVIRITRDALRNYLAEHPDRYSKELLDAFNVTRSAFKQQLRDPVKTIDDLTNLKDPVEGEVVGVIDANRDYIYQNQEWSVCGYHKFKTEESFIPGTTKTPSGAWAELLKETKALNKSNTTDEDDPDEKAEQAAEERQQKYAVRRPYYNKIKKCQILIDGRIAIANVSSYTAQNIINELMQDNFIEMKSIEIKFEEV